MKAVKLIAIVGLFFTTTCEIMRRNTIADCRQQCKDSKKSKQCLDFCDCIHLEGRPLDSYLDDY